MKKSIALVALAFGVSNAFAQDLTSKKGEPILPEAGDWGIGVDATPFLEYAGNFFGKSANNAAPTFNFLSTNQVITGRYFKDAQTVYRGSLRIGFGGNTQRQDVANLAVNATPATYPAPDPTVENSLKQSNTAIGLSFGIEKRKGKTRLQGYYGAEVGIYVSSAKDKYTYGNALNPTPTGTNSPVNVSPNDNFPGMSNVTTIPSSGAIGNARITEKKYGVDLSVGVRAFVGVEYFILPKMSIGGEFGWGLGLSTIGKSTTTYESVGNTGVAGTNDIVGTTKITNPKGGNFKLDTDNKNSVWGASGAIRLNFYF